MLMKYIAIIQARMTSSRYPGKMLAPFLGKPVLAHVVDRLRQSGLQPAIILATSDDRADDPLALYGQSLGIIVERGPRDDVQGRFALVLQKHPCQAFFRVCGDSPLLLPHLFDKAAKSYSENTLDLVTNVFPRTFPVGMSIELINTKTFLELEGRITDGQDREHLTRYFYRHPDQFEICNIECSISPSVESRLAIDELADLKKLEKWVQEKGSDYYRLFPCSD